jgi:hypothetical protein
MTWFRFVPSSFPCSCFFPLPLAFSIALCSCPYHKREF